MPESDPERLPSVRQPTRALKLTPKQAAERLGVSDSLVYEWCSAGILPHYRFGRSGKRGKILIDEVELEAFMAAHRRQPPAEAPILKHIKLGHG